MTSLTVPWSSIFGNCNPVHFEIGPGKGAYLLSAARQRPELNFYGVEWARSKAMRLAGRILQAGLANAIVVNADATCVIATLVEDESVEAYHIYFPDPWPKRRHRQRRLFTSPGSKLPAEIIRTLRPSGQIYLASDLSDYLDEIVATFRSTANLNLISPSVEVPATNFAIKYRKEGRRISRACLLKPP